MPHVECRATYRSPIFAVALIVFLAAVIGCGGGGGSSTSSTALTNGSTALTGGTATTSGNNGSTPSTGEGPVSTINFDDLATVPYASGNPVPEEARLSDRYLNTLGVRFTSGAPFVAAVVLPEGKAPSGTNAISGVSAAGNVSFSRTNPIVVTFFDPADSTKKGVVKHFAVTADRDGAPGQTLTLQAYDINNNLLGTFSGPDDGGGETVYIDAAQPVIHQVKILGATNETNGIAIDDVAFKPVVRAP